MDQNSAVAAAGSTFLSKISFPLQSQPGDPPADASGTRIVHNQHLLKSTEIYEIDLLGPALGSRVYLPSS